MAKQEIDQGSPDEDQLHDEPHQLLDDRWTIDYFRNTSEVILAGLHLRPGEEVPDWFETCPWCSGNKCEECDQTGHIHPKRVEWFEDYLLEAQVDFFLFLALLKKEAVTVPRMHVAIVTLGPIMGQFLEDWQTEDSNLGVVLAEIEKSWITPAR